MIGARFKPTPFAAARDYVGRPRPVYCGEYAGRGWMLCLRRRGMGWSGRMGPGVGRLAWAGRHGPCGRRGDGLVHAVDGAGRCRGMGCGSGWCKLDWACGQLDSLPAVELVIAGKVYTLLPRDYVLKVPPQRGPLGPARPCRIAASCGGRGLLCSRSIAQRVAGGRRAGPSPDPSRPAQAAQADGLGPNLASPRRGGASSPVPGGDGRSGGVVGRLADW